MIDDRLPDGDFPEAHPSPLLLPHRPLRVLTVGEGDLSYSVALSRVFGGASGRRSSSDGLSGSGTLNLNELPGVQMTATTLPNRTSLSKIYALAQKNINELEGIWDQTVLHNVDENPKLQNETFDAICFSHPHLGLHDLADEAAHAAKHSVLVGHFLHAASQLLRLNNSNDNDNDNTSGKGGTIHLTLCGNQSTTWGVKGHAERLGLVIIREKEPSSIHSFLPLGEEDGDGVMGACPIDAEAIKMAAVAAAAGQTSKWAARRKFRSGALGSKHWLGKFGYEHRRTGGDDDMKVERSVEIVFGIQSKRENKGSPPRSPFTGKASCDSSSGRKRCNICGHRLEEKENEDMHVKQMALPIVSPSTPARNTKWKCEKTKKTFTTEYALLSFLEQQKSQPNAPLKPRNVNESTLPSKVDKSQCIRIEHTVPESCDGDRAKNHVRKVAFSQQLRTKKLSHAAFTEDRVLLKESPIEETRLVRAGDVLTFLHDPSGTCIRPSSDSNSGGSNATGILSGGENPHQGMVSIRWAKDDVAVVWKPRGIRCRGFFDATLQSALRPILPPIFTDGSDGASTRTPNDAIPISRLEIGCSGFCLVSRTPEALKRLEARDSDGEIFHTFVALVHGRVPEEWREGNPMYLPEAKKSRRHKRKAQAVCFTPNSNTNEENLKGKCTESDPDDNDDVTTSTHDNAPKLTTDMVTATLLSVTDKSSTVSLSTIQITSHARSGKLFGDICHALRTRNHAVVGDKFARSDQRGGAAVSSLPRYCSPISKGKVQLRCYGIRVDAEKIDCNTTVPLRMMATTWSSAENAVAAKRSAED